MDAEGLGCTVGPGRFSDEDGCVGGAFAELANDEVTGYRLAVEEAVLATLDDEDPMLKICRLCWNELPGTEDTRVRMTSLALDSKNYAYEEV